MALLLVVITLLLGDGNIWNVDTKLFNAGQAFWNVYACLAYHKLEDVNCKWNSAVRLFPTVYIGYCSKGTKWWNYAMLIYSFDSCLLVAELMSKEQHPRANFWEFFAYVFVCIQNQK